MKKKKSKLYGVRGELGRHRSWNFLEDRYKLIDMVEVTMVSCWGRLVNGSWYKLSSMLYKL